MIARQSVWTDPEVKELAAKFIPAADEVGRLQSGKDAECRLFQKIAEQGHYAGRTRPSGTRQGTYATTADGTFLASWNNNNPRFVARKLREALKNWDRLKAEGRKFSGEDPLDIAQLSRADRFFPEGGLVLKVNTRDLPRDPPQQGRGPTPGTRTSPGSPRMRPGSSCPRNRARPDARGAAAPRRATRPVPFPRQRARTDFAVSGPRDRGRDTDQPRHGG